MRVAEEGNGEVVVVGESGRLAGGFADEATSASVERMALAALHERATKLEPAGTGLVFTEVLVPPPTLLVVGAGDDARPLVSFAAAAGFRVVLVDHRSARLDARLFPDAWKLVLLRPEEPSTEIVLQRETSAVVKTHSLRLDAEWVRRLAASDVSYVGILGPRARTSKILADLGIEGDERIFGPVGLDLGADGPEQVAVSVVAELLAVRSGREPRHLRLRENAVHASP
jgi:xanthine/CO dehydrogenase XdhC/CoxF family maturation factor